MSVLAVLEAQGGGLHPASREAIGAAQRIAGAEGWPAAAAVLGGSPDAAATQAAGFQLSCVWAVAHPRLDPYTPEAHAAALQALIRDQKPTLVLWAHTYQARDWAPKLAARFGRALVADAVADRLADGRLLFTRQLFQGKLHAEVCFRSEPPWFASLQVGAYPSDGLRPGSAPIARFVPPLEDFEIRTRCWPAFQESARTVDLSAAKVIVAVGRGIKDGRNLPLVERLARALGAELAASRPVCDAGWLPLERQVGSSGQIVAPKLYIAVGISGAIQHLIGMRGSRTVVAINQDPDAPIFEAAHYGIVGDLFQVVPALVQALGDERR